MKEIKNDIKLPPFPATNIFQRLWDLSERDMEKLKRLYIVYPAYSNEKELEACVDVLNDLVDDLTALRSTAASFLQARCDEDRSNASAKEGGEA